MASVVDDADVTLRGDELCGEERIDCNDKRGDVVVDVPVKVVDVADVRRTRKLFRGDSDACPLSLLLLIPTRKSFRGDAPHDFEPSETDEDAEKEHDALDCVGLRGDELKSAVLRNSSLWRKSIVDEEGDKEFRRENEEGGGGDAFRREGEKGGRCGGGGGGKSSLYGESTPSSVAAFSS